MSVDLDVLEAQVLELSPTDREHLFERLIASLESDESVAQAWELEADRREADLDSGLVSTVSGSQALARLRARIA